MCVWVPGVCLTTKSISRWSHNLDRQIPKLLKMTQNAAFPEDFRPQKSPEATPFFPPPILKVCELCNRKVAFCTSAPLAGTMFHTLSADRFAQNSQALKARLFTRSSYISISHSFTFSPFFFKSVYKYNKFTRVCVCPHILKGNSWWYWKKDQQKR